MLLKRTIDIVLALFALIVLSPLLALIALAIWVDSGRPVLFVQQRVGRGLEGFRLYKFRTMRTEPGPSVTVAGDPRVTKVGRLLRASKLDELPQLWNVLRGDMSFVGPRPELPEYVELFRDRYVRILTVRPGITDLASVRFRDEEALLARTACPLKEYVERILPQKLALAEEYLRRRSFWFDLTILAATAAAIFRPLSQVVMARRTEAQHM